MVHSIFLYPIEDTLDVASIERFLAEQPDVLPDPLGTGTYIVCGLSNSKAILRGERLANPSEFPYSVLVMVKPEHMNIFQEYGDESQLRSAKNIVRWTIEHARCRVGDGYGRDWTERVAQHGVGVLYPEWLV